jgi:hypothetical protein
VTRFVTLLRHLPLRLDLWEAQNLYFIIHRTLEAEGKLRVPPGDVAAREWATLFADLGHALHFPG